MVAGATPEVDAGGDDGHGGALDRALKVLLEELPLKQAARLAAQITAVRDNEAYKRALELKTSVWCAPRVGQAVAVSPRKRAWRKVRAP